MNGKCCIINKYLDHRGWLFAEKTKCLPYHLYCFVLLLIGCTNKAPNEYDLKQLTRIDVEVVKADESYKEAFMITDKETIDVVRNSIKQVKWEPNAKSKMARKEDVKATLFFKYDKNMPERLFEYQIWFNQSNDRATIISNNEREGYGSLDKENAQTLENILLNTFRTNGVQ